MNEDSDSVVSQSPGGALLQRSPRTPAKSRQVSVALVVDGELSPPSSRDRRPADGVIMPAAAAVAAAGDSFGGHSQPLPLAVGNPPAQFAQIRNACFEAQPVCFHLQTALHRQAGLTEDAQNSYYKDLRTIGDRLLAIQLANNSLEQELFEERSRTAASIAAVCSQRDAALHDVDQLHHRLRMLQAELAACEDAVLMTHRARSSGAASAHAAPHSTYSQIIGDLRRCSEQDPYSSSMLVRHQPPAANPVTPGRHHAAARYGGASVRGIQGGGGGSLRGGRGGSARARPTADSLSGSRYPLMPYQTHSHNGSFNSHNSSNGLDNSHAGGMPLLTMQPHSSVVDEGMGSPTRRRNTTLAHLRSSAFAEPHQRPTGLPSKQQQQQQQQPHDVPVVGPTPRQLSVAKANGYWAPEDGGSPIPLLKNAMGLRSTSDMRPPGAIGGRPPSASGAVSDDREHDQDAPHGNLVLSPGGDSSLHPSSSASNIRPRRQSPEPFRGQVTPQLSPDEGAAAARRPQTQQQQQAQGQQQQQKQKQQQQQKGNSSSSSSSSAKAVNPAPSAPAAPGQGTMTRYRQPSVPSRAQQQKQLRIFEQQQQQQQAQASINNTAADRIFSGQAPEEDGLVLDAVGREWRKEFEQVFTYVLGWVRGNCSRPSAAKDAQIPRRFPRLWEYMLELTYPDQPQHAAAHVRFLLSDGEVRCYFICRMMVQFLVFHVFSIDAWMADDALLNGAGGQLRGPAKTRLAMLVRMREGLGDAATPEQRRHMQAGQAECVAEMLAHAEWPSVRQQRVSDVVHRFKEMAGPLMDDAADRALASHDLYGIAVGAVETSARVLSARLSFTFGFSECAVKFSHQLHRAINPADLSGPQLQVQQWRVMCVVTPNVTVRDDSGPKPLLRNIAKAKVIVMP